MNKLPDNQKIVDLTTDDMRKVRLNGNETAMNYAKQSSEVLIKGQINSEAVKVLSKSEIEDIKKDPKQQAIIKRECKSGRAHK